MFGFKASAFAVVVACSAISYAASPVLAPIERNDVLTLERLSHDAATPGERYLAQGVAFSLRHRDADALAALLPLTQAADDQDIRAAANLASASVYLRQGRFKEVYSAMRSAQSLRVAPLSSDDLQTMDFALSALDALPMVVTHPATGRLAVTRDMAGLARVGITINGKAIDAVIDSGAGFSTVSESAAKTLGIRILSRGTAVASASKEAVASRLGVADRLHFGDVVLENVIFVVLPDAALSFGPYKIDAIMGLPVFVALQRIELAKEDGKESLYYGAKPGMAGGNLLLAGVEPIVLAGAGEARLRLFIDTGATHTTLNASLARDYPVLTADAKANAATLRGAGGSSEDAKAMTLPALTLTIAGRPFSLSGVSIHSKIEPGQHGAIGQDILKQGARWVLDFEAMGFAVSE